MVTIKANFLLPVYIILLTTYRCPIMELFPSFIHIITFRYRLFLNPPMFLPLHHYGLILILVVESAIRFIGKQPLLPLEREQPLKLDNFFACQAPPSIHPLCSLLHGIMQKPTNASLRWAWICLLNLQLAYNLIISRQFYVLGTYHFIFSSWFNSNPYYNCGSYSHHNMVYFNRYIQITFWKFIFVHSHNFVLYLCDTAWPYPIPMR